MPPVPVVLVVEDNSELRLALKEALGAEGYQVLATRDEIEALEILRGTHVDLFISDLSNRSTAKQALDSVRQEFPELPVVALAGATGYHPPYVPEARQSPPKVRTVSKPFRLGELLAVSREALAPSGSRPSL